MANATRKNGAALFNSIDARANQLPQEFQQRMFDAEARLTDVTDLFVSDYGKLMDFARKRDTPGWTLEEEGRLLTEEHQRGCPPVVCRGTGIAWLLAGTRHATLARGPVNANGLTCVDRLADEGGLHRQRKPLEEGTSGSPRCTVSRGNPAEGRSPRHTSLRRFPPAAWPGSDMALSQAVADLLFGRATSRERVPRTALPAGQAGVPQPWSLRDRSPCQPHRVPLRYLSGNVSQTVDSEARSSAYGHLLRAAAANPAGPDQRPAMRGQEDVRHRRRWPEV